MSVKLDLDNNCSPPVYPGQTISGRVECNFTEETKLRAVQIKFRGRAKCEWVETSLLGSSVRYTAKEVYFDAEYKLVHGDDKFSLPAGKHVYPFSYILAQHLPSSLEGICGNVRYYIKVVVDRPWKSDYEDRVALEVFSPLDLNYVNGAREPCATSVDKTFCSCWCNDEGALTLNISLPCAGFVLGQEVDIGASIRNTSNVNAQDVKLKIVQVIEFIAHHPRTHMRFVKNVLTEGVEAGIGAHGEKSWSSKLLIPASCPFSNMIPCSIININYFLKAKVVTPCPHKNLKTEVPIFIGTVPISGVSNTQFPNPISSPYPSSAGDAPYPENAPYPGGAIYSPNEKSPSGSGGAPYPGPAPYPSGGPTAPGASAASYPPGGSYSPGPGAPLNRGASAPYFSTEAAPPSHNEAENLLEK